MRAAGFLAERPPPDAPFSAYCPRSLAPHGSWHFNPLPLLFPRLPVVVFISTASRQLIRHELHVLLARDESLSKGWYIIEVASSSPNLGAKLNSKTLVVRRCARRV